MNPNQVGFSSESGVSQDQLNSDNSSTRSMQLDFNQIPNVSLRHPYGVTPTYYSTMGEQNLDPNRVLDYSPIQGEGFGYSPVRNSFEGQLVRNPYSSYGNIVVVLGSIVNAISMKGGSTFFRTAMYTVQQFMNNLINYANQADMLHMNTCIIREPANFTPIIHVEEYLWLEDLNSQLHAIITNNWNSFAGLDINFSSHFRDLMGYISHILPDISFHKESVMLFDSIPTMYQGDDKLQRTCYGYLLSVAAHIDLDRMNIRYIFPSISFSGQNFLTVKGYMEQCYSEISRMTMSSVDSKLTKRLHELNDYIQQRPYYVDMSSIDSRLSSLMRAMDAYFVSMIEYGPLNMQSSIQITHQQFRAVYDIASRDNFLKQRSVLQLIQDISMLCREAKRLKIANQSNEATGYLEKCVEKLEMLKSYETENALIKDSITEEYKSVLKQILIMP